MEMTVSKNIPRESGESQDKRREKNVPKLS